MVKRFTIYLAGEEDVRFEDDGVVIDVHAGAPPGKTAVTPRATVKHDAASPPAKGAPSEAEGGSKIHIPKDIDPPFNAIRVERIDDPEAGSDAEQ